MNCNGNKDQQLSNHNTEQQRTSERSYTLGQKQSSLSQLLDRSLPWFRQYQECLLPLSPVELSILTFSHCVGHLY